MLYRITLLRAFSALLLTSVLTACGGGSGGGDGTTPAPTQQDTNTNGTGATGGDTSGTGTTTPTDGTATTGGTDTSGTGTTGGTGSADGTGNTGGTGGTGTGNTGGTGSTGGTGGDTGGTGSTGGNTGGTSTNNTGVSGVWQLDIPALFILAVENLPGNHAGIVDEWLPGRQILMVDHGDSIDVSTCIDNANLPWTTVVPSSTANTYEASTQWSFNGTMIDPQIVKTDADHFDLVLKLGSTTLQKIKATRRTGLNNRFVLEGTGIVSADSTNLTCAVKTTATDGSKTLNVATWYEDNFLYLSFPTIAGVGHYDFDYGKVGLSSETLYYLINMMINSAQLDLVMYEIGKLRLNFDLVTDDAAQLHGEVTLKENPL